MLVLLVGALIALLLYFQPRILGAAANHWAGRLTLVAAAIICTLIHPCLGALAGALYIVAVDHRDAPSDGINDKSLDESNPSASSPNGSPEFNKEVRLQCEDACTSDTHERLATETMLQGRSSSYQPSAVTTVELSGSANHFETTIPLGVTTPKALPTIVN